MSRIVLFFTIIFVTFIEHQCHHLSESQCDGGSSKNIELSSPDECVRACVKDAPPKVCYYKFHLEFYPAVGAACDQCKPNITQGIKSYSPECECILVDGVERVVFSVNRMLPGPQIQVCQNDHIVVDVENGAEGVGATIHWHGIFQKDYQYYDGVPFVTQCPINSFSTFRYQFKAAQGGTFFWHSHVAVHRIDGQYGPLIIRQSPEANPHSSLYDEDDPTHVILISDWMHQLATERFPGLQHRLAGQIAENILINGRGTFTFPNDTTTNIDLATFYIEPHKRYRFRLINSFTSTCTAQFSIEDHPLLMIAQDGADNEPVVVDTIVTAAGERVDFVVNANMTAKPYWIQVRGLGECSEAEVNQLAVLQYKGGEQESASKAPSYVNGFPRGILYNPLDGSCDPDGMATICPSNIKTSKVFNPDILRLEPDVQLILPFWFHNYEETNTLVDLFSANKSHYPMFFVTPDQFHLVSLIDNIIFESAAAPPLSEAEGRVEFCDGPNSNKCKNLNGPLPCACTHVRKIPLHSLVEVIVYDKVPLPWVIHPFHLHGTNYHVLDMGRFDDNRNISEKDIKHVMVKHRQRLENHEYSRPAQKDTVLVPQGGWVIFRYIADNPGIWAFHCHFDWHAITGMQVLFQVGEQSDLPPVPQAFPTCGNFKPPVCIAD